MGDLESLDKKSTSGVGDPDAFSPRGGDDIYGASVLDMPDSTLFDDLSVPGALEVERMALNEAAAANPELRMKLELFKEAEQYLAAYDATEKALEDSIPPFSEMVDAWVEAALTESAAGGPITDLERAKGYQALLYELEEEYQEFIHQGSLEAQAEWDAVSAVVESRVTTFTYKDIVVTLREELDLAA